MSFRVLRGNGVIELESDLQYNLEHSVISLNKSF